MLKKDNRLKERQRRKEREERLNEEARRKEREFQENLKRQEARRARKEAQKEAEMKEKTFFLVSSGLINAYEYFIQQLAVSGIPQSNVYEFAAQSMLKYGRKMKKKQQELKSIDCFNKNAAQRNGQRAQQVQNTAQKGQKKKLPRVLPFKRDLLEQEKGILQKDKFQ